MSRPLRVAVLVKQVPLAEEFQLGGDGRLLREHVPLEINPYCRRAITKGIELATSSGGQCVAFTLGPPAAEEVLREAIAAGASEGIHVCDPAFAGSDTLATARALAAAIGSAGPFDLVLAGLNSVDADTGQVGPELAELLGLPFASGVRHLSVDGGQARVLCERDDGTAKFLVQLPAVLSVAERLCPPAKFGPPERASVPPAAIRRLLAAQLGPGPWGAAGSPTRVGEIRAHEEPREGRMLAGPPADQVAAAIRLLAERSALPSADWSFELPEPPGAPGPGVLDHGDAGTSPGIIVLVEPGRPELAKEVLGAAARLASEFGATTTAVCMEPASAAELGSWGADQALVLSPAGDDPLDEEAVARVVAARSGDSATWAILAPSTSFGRHVAARVAARLGAGLTGDAIDLTVAGDRMVAWKPAFAGRLVAAITAASSVQMATLRPGVFAPVARRPSVAWLTHERVQPSGRIRIITQTRDGGGGPLTRAACVVAVGAGVPPDRYGELSELLRFLSAELVGTRKVTDQGWLPRSRQIGLTGHSIGPRLYLALGLSGKFNHLVGVRRAGTVLAVNTDPSAPVFAGSDIGIVADWREIVPLLTAGLARLTDSAPLRPTIAADPRG